MGRSPGEGNGNPLQYSHLENPMNGGAWWSTVCGVAKSQTQLSDFIFFLSFLPLSNSAMPLSIFKVISIFLFTVVHKKWKTYELCQKTAVSTHSSPLAWKIPWTEEPGRLQSMGLQRVGHNWATYFHFRALEEEMATHSSGLAWRIPGTGEPGRLSSIGLHRVRHDWSDLEAPAAAAATATWALSLTSDVY